jgi:hypothetical protein
MLCARQRKPSGSEHEFNVARRAQVLLKMVCYAAHNYQRTSCVMDAGESIYDNNGTFDNHQKEDVDYMEPMEKHKGVKVEMMLDFVEEWPEKLALFDGQCETPLLYVIQDEVGDPPFGEADQQMEACKTKSKHLLLMVGVHIASAMPWCARCPALKSWSSRTWRPGSNQLRLGKIALQA